MSRGRRRFMTPQFMMRSDSEVDAFRDSLNYWVDDPTIDGRQRDIRSDAVRDMLRAYKNSSASVLILEKGG